MEKRVFSLSSRGRWITNLFLAMWILVSALNVLVSHGRDPWEYYTSLGFLLLLLAIYPVSLWFDRVSKLEVTDEGLLLTRWLLKPMSMDWISISNVRLTMEPVPFGGGRYYDPAILIRETSGRKIYIPGTCRSAKEIVGVVKERLPERVFETRWRKFF